MAIRDKAGLSSGAEAHSVKVPIKLLRITDTGGTATIHYFITNVITPATIAAKTGYTTIVLNHFTAIVFAGI